MPLSFLPIASSSAGCSYLLSCDGHTNPLLLDAGVSYDRIQKAIGYKMSTLAACLITHAHGDHIMSARRLMDRGINCYATRETWEHAPLGITPHHRALAFSTEEVTSLHGIVQETYNLHKIGGWLVLPFEAVHDMPGTVGFYIAAPDGSRAIYLTDTQYSKNRFKGLTHIFIECNFSMDILRGNVREGKVDRSRYKRVAMTHMSLEQLKNTLKANDLSKVQEIWLLHLSAQNSNAEQFKQEIQMLTGKAVYIAGEGGGAT